MNLAAAAIAEPMTVATDGLVALFAFTFGALLLKHRGREEPRVARWWAAAFAAVGVYALVGGAFHGFGPALGEPAARALWKLTVFGAGFVGFAILGATILSHAAGRIRRLLLCAAAAKLVLYLAWMATHDAFVWVIADYGGSMLIALIVHAWAWHTRRSPAGPWIVAAVIVSLAAAAVQASGFTLHRHFNHNDLFHVLQLPGLALFYRGALLARREL